jgi:YOP proteins translocation protein K (YscK)
LFNAAVDQLVFDFNCRPGSYIDPSWLDDETGRSLLPLTGSADAQARGLADVWLLDHFAIADGFDFDFDFTHPARRLLLLDGQTLRDVALMLGLSALSHLLRTWVTGASQRALQRALGDDAFGFFHQQVLTRRPVSRPVVGSALAQRWLHDASWPAVAERFGTRLLLLGCEPPGGALFRRAQLKLPRAHSEMSRARPLPDARRHAVLEFCIGCVVQHRHSTWHWLF